MPSAARKLLKLKKFGSPTADTVEIHCIEFFELVLVQKGNQYYWSNHRFHRSPDSGSRIVLDWMFKDTRILSALFSIYYYTTKISEANWSRIYRVMFMNGSWNCSYVAYSYNKDWILLWTEWSSQNAAVMSAYGHQLWTFCFKSLSGIFGNTF
jgi:hypothetical protein